MTMMHPPFCRGNNYLPGVYVQHLLTSDVRRPGGVFEPRVNVASIIFSDINRNFLNRVIGS